MTAPVLDIVVESPLWAAQRGVKAVLRRAIAAAAAMVSTSDGELAIVLTDDSAMRALNRHWRGKDAPTNVLAFPQAATAPPADAPVLLGDVVLAFETVCFEAVEQQKPFADHLSQLVVHGVLHLLGFDHEKAADAAAMEAREIKILAGLGVPDPYRGIM